MHMRSTWNRRDLVGFAAMSGVVATIAAGSTRRAIAQTPSASTAGGAKLGDDEDAFAAEFGAGTEIDGGMVQFGTTDSDTAVYYVRFTESGADHAEVDFTHLPDGGVTEEEADVGNSRFLLDDAVMSGQVVGGRLQFNHAGYYLTTWHSEALAAETGRTGNVLVLDEFTVQGDGPGIPAPFSRATISMEAFDEHEVQPHGEGATLGTSLESWWDAYGQGNASQRASHVANPPVEQLFLGTNQGGFVVEIDTNLERELPIQEAIDLVGQFLPANATLTQTYFAPPSPTGPIGLRTQLWNLSALKAVPATVTLYVNGSEASGTVSRILMVMGEVQGSLGEQGG